ncbi:MAG TPA: PaaI family thioesterase [Thermoanaerobacterales bacterium]|jgi:uncharacterized protein (TIGR00369 family)|nr:PaaI family thioesterase [Thermoanaerobacterales bacterium]
MTINKGIDEKLFNEIIEKNFPSPFHELLKFRLSEISPGNVVVEVIPDENFSNFKKILHGGVTATLCDTAMGFAVRSLGVALTTVEMKINYLAPGIINEKLRAVGNVVKHGKTLLVAEAKIYCKDKLIAISSGTYFNLEVIAKK